MPQPLWPTTAGKQDRRQAWLPAAAMGWCKMTWMSWSSVPVTHHKVHVAERGSRKMDGRDVLMAYIGSEEARSFKLWFSPRKRPDKLVEPPITSASVDAHMAATSARRGSPSTNMSPPSATPPSCAAAAPAVLAHLSIVVAPSCGYANPSSGPCRP